jgi:rRNA maturation protein Nop10
MKRYGNYRRNASRIVKRFGKYRRQLWKDMKNMEEK